MRKMAGGDTFCIIYLKMQLKAMRSNGVLTWRGYEQDFVDELAMDLDEEPDNVRITLAYLLSCGLAETEDKVNFFLPYSIENTGSEGASAKRWRDWKARQDEKALDTNAALTQSKQITNGEKEIEIEKEKEIQKDIVRRFTPPTIEEIKGYCAERGNTVDAEKFHAYYTANGWKVGRNSMKDWRAAVRTWERDEKKKPKNRTPYDNLRTEMVGDDAERLARSFGVTV